VSAVTHADFDRALPFEGAFNLRDMGGYATADGGRVKRGMLYRSGTMAMLTEEAERQLGMLGIATVCDLRRANERAAAPTRWCEPAGVHYWSRDYQESSGVLADVIRSTEPTRDAMHAAMVNLYRDIPTDHAPSYRVMFERLLGGHVPLLFNCAAGKDRTGFGAVLILHTLGVPHDTIIEDYLLTNTYADFSRFTAKRESSLTRLAEQTPEIVAPLFAADADYLSALFETLDRDFDGIDGYLANSLSVDAEARSRLRALLVE